MSGSMDDSVIERAFFLFSSCQMENTFAVDKHDMVSMTFFFNEHHLDVYVCVKSKTFISNLPMFYQIIFKILLNVEPKIFSKIQQKHQIFFTSKSIFRKLWVLSMQIRANSLFVSAFWRLTDWLTLYYCEKNSQKKRSQTSWVVLKFCGATKIASMNLILFVARMKICSM